MANHPFTFLLLLKGVDMLTAPAKSAFSAIQRLDNGAQRATHLKALAGDMKSLGDGMQRLGAYTLGLGLGAGALLGLGSVVRDTAEAQHALVDIGNTADLTSAQIAEAGSRLRTMSTQTNQTRQELIDGLGILTAAGLSFGDAIGALPAIGKTATSQVAQISDIANTSFSLISNMKLEVGDLSGTLDMLAAAAHAGQFELKDMAQFFPQITASAAAVGITGKSSILALAAALQVARRGAGNAAEAATNFKNFLDKLAAPETQRNFAKFGISVKAEMEKAVAAGEDPIQHMMTTIRRITGGDPYRLGELFGDIQVQSFLKPMQQYQDIYKSIKEQGAKGGVIDPNFTKIMATGVEQAKQLRINMQNAASAQLEGPLQAVTSLLTIVNGSPGMQKLLLLMTEGAIGFGGGAIALGALTKGVGTYITAAKGAALFTRLFAAGWAGHVGQITGGARLIALSGKWLAGLVPVFMSLTTATWTWTTALLSNPIVGTIVAVVAAIAAIGGAVYFVIKNWSKISAFFVRLWGGIKSITHSFLLWLEQRVAHVIRTVPGLATVLGLMIGKPIPLAAQPTRSAAIERVATVDAARRNASTFTYAPTVHVPPGTPQQNVAAVRGALAQDRADMQRLVADANRANAARDARKQY